MTGSSLQIHSCEVLAEVAEGGSVQLVCACDVRGKRHHVVAGQLVQFAAPDIIPHLHRQMKRGLHSECASAACPSTLAWLSDRSDHVTENGQKDLPCPLST